MRRRPLVLLAAAPLFYADILPILERHCLSCHRPGHAAPMPLETFEQARPFARAIRDAVLRRTMPPWFADAPPGVFANDPRLSPAEIRTIRQWADNGAPPGIPASPLPPPAGAWRIPSPDAVLAMPVPFPIPAHGEVDYQHVIVPTGFTRDRWISAIEVRPTSFAHVHHAVVFVRPPRSVWLRAHPPNQLFSATGQALQGLSTLDEVIATYLPGAGPLILPPGHAKLIPAGSDIVFQIHYTPNGRPATDQTRLALVFAPSPPRIRHYSLAIAEGKFSIPPLTPAHPVHTEFQVHTATEIYALAPHMHLRGKSMRVRAITPDETEIDILHVPHYNFNWQLVYQPRKPIPIPRATKIVIDAVFDNSPANPRNPDPKATVTWGEQSHEEMLVCFIDFLLPIPISPNELFRPPRL